MPTILGTNDWLKCGMEMASLTTLVAAALTTSHNYYTVNHVFDHVCRTFNKLLTCILFTFASHSSVISVVAVVHSNATVIAGDESRLSTSAVNIVQKYSSTTFSKKGVAVSSGTCVVKVTQSLSNLINCKSTHL